MTGKYIKRMIDIGANLTDPMFRGIYHSTKKHSDDFAFMMKRAKEAGVEKMIVTGGSLTDSKEALSIAQENEHLFSTVGCHPTRCGEFETHPDGPDAYLDELRKLIVESRSKVVAIGELGLDYDRLHFCPKETQKLFFERQLSLAESLNLPLFLHNRNSIDDFIEILSRNSNKFSSRGGVVHSFDGTLEDLQRILSMGLYVGINGCSLKTDQNLEVAKMIPSNKLMIETDCPWCEIKKSHASFKHVTTVLQKSKDAKDDKLLVKNRNEPSSLIQVLEVLSSIRNENIEELAEQVWSNTNKLFF